MRLDFNVLWVDDQPDRVAAQIRAIEKGMEHEGFWFNATIVHSMSKLQEELGDGVFTDEIDLVLVDWDLGDGVKGQKAIVEIRKSAPYKDIVFYSAQTPADTLRRLAFEEGAEGVYCASREDLVDEVLGVFESLVKKVLDLDHSRGIVMGATSDVDRMVNECLTAMHFQQDKPGQEGMVTRALELAQRNIDNLTNALNKLRDKPTLDGCLELHALFTANERLRVLARALECPRFAPHKKFRKPITQYQQNVVPMRNRLGHRSQDQQFTLDEMRELRRLILVLRGDFRNLVIALEQDCTADPGID